MSKGIDLIKKDQMRKAARKGKKVAASNGSSSGSGGNGSGGKLTADALAKLDGDQTASKGDTLPYSAAASLTSASPSISSSSSSSSSASSSSSSPARSTDDEKKDAFLPLPGHNRQRTLSSARKEKAKTLFEGTVKAQTMARMLFDEFDRSQKGYLVQDELSIAMQQLDPSFTHDQLEVIFHKLDTEHNGKITLAQFESGFSFFLRGKEKDDAIKLEGLQAKRRSLTASNINTGFNQGQHSHAVEASPRLEPSTTPSSSSLSAQSPNVHSHPHSNSLETLTELNLSEQQFTEVADKAKRLHDATTKNMATELYQVLDEDGDGSISKEDLCNCMLDIDPTFTTEELEDLFDKMDVDGSGTLSKEEFQEGFFIFQERSRLHALANSKSSLPAVHEEMKTEVLETAGTDLEEELQRKQTAIIDLQRQLERVQQGAEKTARRYTKVAEEHAIVDSQNEELKQQSAQLQAQLLRQKQEADEYAEKLKAREAALQAMEQKQRELEESLQRAEKAKQEREEQLRREKERAAELQSTVVTNSAELEQLKKEKAAERAERERKRQAEFQAAHAKLKQMEAKIEEYKRMEEKLISQKTKEEEEREKEVAELKSFVSVLKGTIAQIDPQGILTNQPILQSPTAHGGSISLPATPHLANSSLGPAAARSAMLAPPRSSRHGRKQSLMEEMEGGDVTDTQSAPVSPGPTLARITSGVSGTGSPPVSPHPQQGGGLTILVNSSTPSPTNATVSTANTGEQKTAEIKKFKNEMYEISRTVYRQSQLQKMYMAREAKSLDGKLTDDERVAVEEEFERTMGTTAVSPPSRENSVSPRPSQVALNDKTKDKDVKEEMGKWIEEMRLQNEIKLKEEQERLRKENELKLKEDEEKRRKEAEILAKKVGALANTNDDLSKRLMMEVEQRAKLEEEQRWLERQLAELEERNKQKCVIL